jgi:ligand-binding sensor domain-containing protein
LARYDGKTWSSVDTRSGLLDNNVYAIAIAPNGDIWAGTKRGVAHVVTK